MSTSVSVRIPAGKLGTVRVDRTVDIYSTPIINNEEIFNVKSYIPRLVLQRQLSIIPHPLIIENWEEEHGYIPKTKWNHRSYSDDEDISDIAVIYSVVRCSTTRRTSSPRLSVAPLMTNFNIPQAYIAKSYTLEPPLTPIVTHVSKQAQIKTLLSTRTSVPSVLTSTSTSSQLIPPTRIQASTSFTSHDRPSVPLIAIKPRPYSFRTTGRSVLERQISNITERVSHLHETLFSRLSNAPNNQQRNRSLSTFHSRVTDTNMNEYNALHRHSIRPRPKSETFDDH
jgi:hypothetical protein